MPKSLENNCKQKELAKGNWKRKGRANHRKKWQNIVERYLNECEILKKKINGNLGIVLKTNVTRSCLLTISE